MLSKCFLYIETLKAINGTSNLSVFDGPIMVIISVLINSKVNEYTT